jgi:hypothetical protein
MDRVTGCLVVRLVMFTIRQPVLRPLADQMRGRMPRHQGTPVPGRWPALPLCPACVGPGWSPRRCGRARCRLRGSPHTTWQPTWHKPWPPPALPNPTLPQHSLSPPGAPSTCRPSAPSSPAKTRNGCGTVPRPDPVGAQRGRPDDGINRVGGLLFHPGHGSRVSVQSQPRRSAATACGRFLRRTTPDPR